MNTFKLIVALLVAAALVVFGAQNTDSVGFHFLVWDTPSVPAVLALAVAVLLGVLLGWLASAPGRFRARRRRRDLERQLGTRAREATPQESVEPPPEPHDQPE